MSSAWFYLHEQKPVGPVTDRELRGLLGAGALQPHDLVWREGQSSWLPAASAVPNLDWENAPIPPPVAAKVTPPARPSPPPEDPPGVLRKLLKKFV
jgi:hypothetical protein